MDRRIDLARLIPPKGASRSREAKQGDNPSGAIFAEILQHSLHSAPSATQSIRLSTHAEKRLAERCIPFGDDVRNLLSSAMTELQARGARDSLILTDQGAFVVNVPTRTLVTAMNQDDLSGRIVTQIDSISIKTGS